MNEAYLAGELYEIEKVLGTQVLRGAVNGDIASTLRADRLALDSRVLAITAAAGSSCAGHTIAGDIDHSAIASRSFK